MTQGLHCGRGCMRLKHDNERQGMCEFKDSKVKRAIAGKIK